MISRNDPCWCGSQKKFKKCHYPQYPNRDLPKTYLKNYGIIIKNQKQIQGIKNSCKIAAKILDKLCKAAKEGVTTLELDDFANELHKKYGVIPAPLNYGSPPFPKSICTSLNDVVCHGIPDKTKLKEGDILNIDVTCIADGYYGDTSKMVMIKDVTDDKKRVIETSYQCMMDAIKILKPGIKIYEIAEIIEKIAKEKGCSVVNQFVGHGVGVGFHEPPQIPHSYNNIQIPLVPGMTFTIEPMINAGVKECEVDLKDHWTARTVDSKPSAQFEHTILITENSHEILTLI